MEKTKIQALSEALVCWLDYESRCGRSDLLDEYALYRPVWDFLVNRHYGAVLAQKPLKDIVRGESCVGRPQTIDFALLKNAEDATDVIEIKFQRDRSIAKEIFSDLFRLAAIERNNLQRWFVLVGKRTHIFGQPFFEKTGQVGDGQARQPVFRGLLPEQLGGKLKTVICNVQDHRTKLWKQRIEEYDIHPNTISLTLVGRSESRDENGWACLVWRIRKFYGTIGKSTSGRNE